MECSFEFTLIFFVKLDFEIAVVQQTKARDLPLGGFRTPGACRTAAPIFGQFVQWSNFAK